MGSEISSPRMLKNGMEQGSVLAPLLFVPFISDMPQKTSTTLRYSNDWALTIQITSIEEAEEFLSEDMKVMRSFFKIGDFNLMPAIIK